MDKAEMTSIWRELKEDHPVITFLIKYGALLVALEGFLGSIYYLILLVAMLF